MNHTPCGVVRTVDRNYIGQMRKMFSTIASIKWTQILVNEEIINLMKIIQYDRNYKTEEDRITSITI